MDSGPCAAQLAAQDREKMESWNKFDRPIGILDLYAKGRLIIDPHTHPDPKPQPRQYPQCASVIEKLQKIKFQSYNYFNILHIKHGLNVGGTI